MDSESLAAAGLLAAMSRAAASLAALRHPFVRSEPFCYFFPPAGVRAGTAFMLPDGREVRFTVSVAASDGAFHVEGAAWAEGEALLDLPACATSGIHDGIAVLDDYAAELVSSAARLIDQLLDELV
ncbi:hypothetical protein HTZ77_20355 [Nonomuraea sp. SMC257]|uniref:Uncharacterized protein n=1 Tax=Nonomuraea montanisoli TaxID=2741721 RepID=A0A7Y6M4Z4_9ACTN|nr:hypothetical protein [Nonomuraea montanisoli]NUW33769.1 hypothetical protein [Nonomuraea montanisoli]